MLVYGECECFVMQMLYVCVLCAFCGSSQCCVLHNLQFVNAGRGCNRRPYRRTQNKQISIPEIILTQSRRRNTSITTMPPLRHQHTRHTSSLQLHPHTHHIVTPGFVDRPRRSDCAAGRMDGEAGWWTTCGNIGLPPLARVMGVGRQQQHHIEEAYSRAGLITAL